MVTKNKITATDLARNLSEVLNRVRYRGERFLIERNGEPVAALYPAGATPGIALAELADRLGDLRSPGEGFADDLEALQTGQSNAGPPPWDS